VLVLVHDESSPSPTPRSQTGRSVKRSTTPSGRAPLRLHRRPAVASRKAEPGYHCPRVESLIHRDPPPLIPKVLLMPLIPKVLLMPRLFGLECVTVIRDFIAAHPFVWTNPICLDQ
jgi:hypothetical protein